MKTKIIEVSQQPNGGGWSNHGKFMLGRFDVERERGQLVGDVPYPLLNPRWHPATLLVLDLETGEGALFTPGGMPSADLRKHKIWVCPMFEPFLEWLYQQDTSDLDALPNVVALPDAEFAMYGYRRPGE